MEAAGVAVCIQVDEAAGFCCFSGVMERLAGAFVARDELRSGCAVGETARASAGVSALSCKRQAVMTSQRELQVCRRFLTLASSVAR